jgi:hypothetical protein
VGPRISPSNLGGVDQSATRWKSTSPPKNLASLKSTWLPENSAPGCGKASYRFRSRLRMKCAQSKVSGRGSGEPGAMARRFLRCLTKIATLTAGITPQISIQLAYAHGGM